MAAVGPPPPPPPEWVGRLSEAAYTSPSGIRTVLTYENVSESFDKKTTGFEIGESNETFVQDLGHTGLRLPLRIFFTGSDYDLDATKFLDTLRERGVGILEHPIYGTFDCVPFGTIKRRDDLKTAAHQAVFEIEFWETTRLLFPVAGTAPADATIAAIEESVEENSESFANRIDIDTQIEEVSLTARFQDALGKVRVELSPIAFVLAETETAFNAVFDSINAGIDTLIGDPASLAFQAQILVGIPARSTALIGDRLDAYDSLLSSLTFDVTPSSASGSSDAFNQYQADELFAMATVLGATTSVVVTEFATKSDTVAAADALLSMFETLSTWRDDNYRNLDQIDPARRINRYCERCSTLPGS